MLSSKVAVFFSPPKLVLVESGSDLKSVKNKNEVRFFLNKLV